MGWLTWPVGLTMMVNVFDDPVQDTPLLVKVGVTVIEPVTGEVPEFVAVKDMLPVPLAPRPIAVLLLVQMYVVVPPVLTVLKFRVVNPPLHTAVSLGWLTWPEGLTVTSKLKTVPGHKVGDGPVGVMTYRTTPGEVPEFSRVWLIRDPQEELQSEKPVIDPAVGGVTTEAVQV